MVKKEMPEILAIRQELRLSRGQFGRFINRSSQSVRRYDEGAQPPFEVLLNARKYLRLFRIVRGEIEE